MVSRRNYDFYMFWHTLEHFQGKSVLLVGALNLFDIIKSLGEGPLLSRIDAVLQERLSIVKAGLKGFIEGEKNPVEEWKDEALLAKALELLYKFGIDDDKRLIKNALEKTIGKRAVSSKKRILYDPVAQALIGIIGTIVAIIGIWIEVSRA